MGEILMTRRLAFRELLWVAVVCSLSTVRLSVAQAALAGQPQRPNVFFIITDQQHAGMLSCAGNPHLKTPAMDGLARSGVRFERAYCGNPVCVPSRVTMLAGVLPSRIGMESNEDMRKVNLTDDILQGSLGRVFRAAGYQTVYGGKVHVPMTLEQMGFDTVFKDQRAQLADDCAAFLRQKHDKPFLLVASFINPHDICYMAIRAFEQANQSSGQGNPTKKRAEQGLPKVEISMLDDALKLPPGMSRETFFGTVCPPLPANFEIPPGEPLAARMVDARNFRSYVRQHWSAEDWRLHRWAYCRLTERVDGEIATVLQALRDAGMEENTLVVLTSDHGDMDSAHRLEHKSVLYEEAARVPFIVSLKGATKPGVVDHQHLVSTGLDLIPTLCDYAGIAPPRGRAGRSVRALAEGHTAIGWRESLVVESNRSRMIRTARFKYTVYDSGEPREVLTDLVKDPGEMHNLAAETACQEVLQQHRKLLVEWYRNNGERLDEKYIVR
jgi:arylsulfatase A-like enzyme